MRAGIIAALLGWVSLSTGCANAQLRLTTLRVSQTVPDIQERQVLDNLARIASEPGNLPYYSVINTGLVNISDNGSGGLSSLHIQPRLYTEATLNANASRTVTGNWTLNPLVSPDRLRAMRAAYQIALGAGPVDPHDLKKLEEIEKSQSLPGIAPGWLCVGGKHEAPRDCRLVAHQGHTYVWVKPEHVKEFADFSLLILNIATFAPSPPSGPSTSKISLSIENLPPIQIKEPSRTPQSLTPSTEALPANPPPSPAPAPSTPSGIQPRLYEDSPSINRGLFFVPR